MVLTLAMAGVATAAVHLTLETSCQLLCGFDTEPLTESSL